MFYKYHYTDKEILFYYTTNNKQKVYVYNGQEFKKITPESLDDRIKNAYSYPEILVWKEDKKACMNYDEYIKNVQHLNKITDINIYRTGSLTNTVKWLFSTIHTEIKPEKVEEYEFNYIMNCGGGARVSEKYEGEAYKYDICSFYPSLMCGNVLKIPIKRGILTTIDQEEFNKMTYIKYGIYNVEISYRNEQDKKSFTLLNSNMYTHYEVNYAKKLNMSIKVLGQHILYSNESVVKASSLFKQYIDKLWPYKYQNPIVKELLNLLWGTLVSSSGGYQNIVSRLDEFELQSDCKLLNMVQIDDELYRFKIQTPIKSVCEYARLKPFLLGYARTKMHQTYEKIGYEYIKFSHTDSMICSRRLHNKELKFNSKDEKIMGNWNFEGYDKKCVITNCNQYKFNSI